MPIRLDPGINIQPIPAGVVLTTDEWHRLTDPLDLAGRELDEVFDVLTGRVAASYNVAHVVRELLEATGEGQSVPPRDLPGQIKRLGQRIRQHEHTERTLAGEVADLTDRLERVLPDVFEVTLDRMADDTMHDLTGETTEEAAGMLVDAGCAALRIALRIVTTFDVRDRDVPRPVTPPAPQEATPTLWGVPVTTDHPAVTYIAEHCGPLTGCDGSPGCRAATILRAFKDVASEWWADPAAVEGHRGQIATRVTDELIRLTAAGTRHSWLRALVLDAIDRSRLVELARPCTVCDGRGATHRLGCPNG